MSSTMVVSPIVAALVKSEDILGKNRTWDAVNDVQQKFLKDFFSRRKELSGFPEKELKCWASWVAAELNAILKKERFDIKLEDFAEDEFGVVSILDVLAEWLKEGMKTKLFFEHQEYPAVRLSRTAEINDKPTKLFLGFVSDKYSFPIASVATKSGDKVWMTVANQAVEGFELVSKIENLRKLVSEHSTATHFDHLIFPMVDLDQIVDIGWLKGMQTNSDAGRHFKISQALQQTKFKMNQFGARVKSAVAIAIRATSVSISQNLLIDAPFYLWVERNGVSYPIMYAYIDANDWKDPGDLGNM